MADQVQKLIQKMYEYIKYEELRNLVVCIKGKRLDTVRKATQHTVK